MDRNLASLPPDKTIPRVATREGGVDRNQQDHAPPSIWSVATREGGVDRNVKVGAPRFQHLVVATREGGVDRNGRLILTHIADRGSPPARVAWIETQKWIEERRVG